MTRTTVALALAFAVSGCGDIFGSDPPSMSDRWEGSITVSGSQVQVSMILSQEGDDVSGSGTFSTSNGSLAFSVEGTHVHPDVSLTIQATGTQDANYTGEFDGDNRIEGRLNGSGFNDAPLNLERQ